VGEATVEVNVPQLPGVPQVNVQVMPFLAPSLVNVALKLCCWVGPNVLAAGTTFTEIGRIVTVAEAAIGVAKLAVAVAMAVTVTGPTGTVDGAI